MHESINGMGGTLPKTPSTHEQVGNRCFCGGALVCLNMGWGGVDDEEQPEQLIAALHKDVLPHAAADQRLTAPVWLLQQQLRSWVLCCQCCSTQTPPSVSVVVHK